MPSTYPDYSYSASPVASLFGVLLCLIPTILVVVGQAKIFLKAGEHWWGALIPFYSSYVMFRIAMGEGWKFLWLIVPFVNIYFAIKINFDLAKSFGKGVGYGFGLLLLPIVFYPLLGLGSDLYIGPQTG